MWIVVVGGFSARGERRGIFLGDTSPRMERRQRFAATPDEGGSKRHSLRRRAEMCPPPGVPYRWFSLRMC